MSRSKYTLPLATALAAAALAPAAASADSILFVKDHNAWLAQPDGTGLHQVTTDGSAAKKYWSPSQADDGTIAVARQGEIVVLRQNGDVVRTIDPPALTDSASQSIDGSPAQVAISPDGARIAYSFTRYSCPTAASCATRSALGYVKADGTPLPSAGAYARHPAWASNSRLTVFAGAGSQVNVHDAASGAPITHWFDDDDFGGTPTDLGDGELSRAGDKLALMHGYGDDSRVRWYQTAGDALSGGKPALPQPRCQSSAAEGIHGPSFSPDGTRLAVGAPEGVFILGPIHVDGTPCDQTRAGLVIPGASEPDWGPADVKPGPKAAPKDTPAPGPQPGPAPQPQPQPRPAPTPGPAPDEGPQGRDAAAATVALAPGQRLRTALRTGLKVRLEGLPAGQVVVQVLRGRKRVGTARVTVGATGKAVAKVKFTRRARRSLGRARTVRLTIVAGERRAQVTLRR